MRFYSNINDKVIALLGTWDRFLPRHKALFKNLLRHSKRKGLNPYVVIFYPHPANFIHENSLKDYFDPAARIALFNTLGINNIIIADMGPEDLIRGPADFLDELFEKTGLALTELWTGENQSLGRGPGGIFTVRTVCAERNIKLKILKNSFLVSIDKDDVNRNFRQGKLDLAAAVVGYFPTCKLSGDLQINMHNGTYNAVLRVNPFDKANELPVTVKIKNEKIVETKKATGYDWLVLLERIASDEELPMYDIIN